mmetsp:Transcript_16110/g.61000  ORF Transcript_16110/g.61000 Transcript_16110/m.61000 type:complete len:325 (-) Transcript_16110:84-1058(-)
MVAARHLHQPHDAVVAGHGQAAVRVPRQRKHGPGEAGCRAHVRVPARSVEEARLVGHGASGSEKATGRVLGEGRPEQRARERPANFGHTPGHRPDLGRGAQVPELQRVVGPARGRDHHAGAHVDAVAANVRPKDIPLRPARAGVPHVDASVPPSAEQRERRLVGELDAENAVRVATGARPVAGLERGHHIHPLIVVHAHALVEPCRGEPLAVHAVVAAEDLVVLLVGVEQLPPRGHVPPPHGPIHANSQEHVPRALGVHAGRAEANSHDRHRVVGCATQRVLELLRGRVEHPDGAVVARRGDEVPVLGHIQSKDAGSHGLEAVE